MVSTISVFTNFFIFHSLVKMKFYLALTAITAANAFAPSTFGARKSMACNAGIVETMKSLQGPEIFWGSEGVLAGFDESDIKGYEGFSKLAAAIEKEGIDLSSGEFTILAPTDAAFDKEVGTPITAEILKYHVIPGKKLWINLPLTRRR